MRIRVAVPGDASGIAAVHVASWRAIYRGHMPDAVLDALDVDQGAVRWRDRLAAPDVDCLVAEEASVLGFCSLTPCRDAAQEICAGEIAAIYLHPDHWRRGLGRALLAAAEPLAHKRGYRSLGLWALRENQRARSFYEAVGFARDGEERIDTGLIGSPLHEVRYVRPVGSGAPGRPLRSAS